MSKQLKTLRIMESTLFSKQKEEVRLNTVRRQIWDALKSGMHLDMVNAQNLCGTRDLRSHISRLRRRIDDCELPYIILDKYKVINESTRCKEYWMVSKGEA